MKTRTAARISLALLAAAVLAWGGVIGATALVLRSDWLRGEIDADPDALFVDFREPRVSIVPGRIRFDTLMLRSRDSNIEFQADLGEVSLDVALPALLRRTLHVRSIRASTLAFRLRERLSRAEATPARVARYPRVVGFAKAPLRGSRPAGEGDGGGDPWRVEVDRLDVALVREIWIDSWRWEGEASVGGGLRLRPGIEAEVLPAELVVERGTLTWGRTAVSHRTTGRVRAALPRFAIPSYPGNEIWKIMSGGASLSGTLEALPFLSPDADAPRPVGGGSVRVDVSMEDGKGGGTVAAHLEDGRALTTLVPSGPPKWLSGLVDLHDLAITARLRIAPGGIAVSPVRARAGTLEVDADWRSAGGRDWGALLVRKGILALGVGLGSGAPALHVLGASEWFETEGQRGGLRTAQPRVEAFPERPTK